MTSTERIRMTRRDYARLRNILNRLRLRRSTPDHFGDYDANLIAIRRRIRAIQNLLTNAVVDEERAGDRIDGPGRGVDHSLRGHR